MSASDAEQSMLPLRALGLAGRCFPKPKHVFLPVILLLQFPFVYCSFLYWCLVQSELQISVISTQWIILLLTLCTRINKFLQVYCALYNLKINEIKYMKFIIFHYISIKYSSCSERHFLYTEHQVTIQLTAPV